MGVTLRGEGAGRPLMLGEPLSWGWGSLPSAGGWEGGLCSSCLCTQVPTEADRHVNRWAQQPPRPEGAKRTTRGGGQIGQERNSPQHLCPPLAPQPRHRVPGGSPPCAHHPAPLCPRQPSGTSVHGEQTAASSSPSAVDRGVWRPHRSLPAPPPAPPAVSPHCPCPGATAAAASSCPLSICTRSPKPSPE